MRRNRRLFALAVAAVLALPAAPAAAKGSIVTQVYVVYQKNGNVPPCTFTATQLKQALKNVTPDIKQYAPDFEDAIKVALESRAAGACDKKRSSGGSTTTSAAPPAGTTTSTAAPAAPAPATTTTAAATPTTTPAPTATPQPDPAVTPAPAAADNAIPAAATAPVSSGADDTPAPLLVLAVLIGVLLVLTGLWAAVRWLGFDPPWVSRWRHASQEAGWRASAAWSEFTDWVRLGR